MPFTLQPGPSNCLGPGSSVLEAFGWKRSPRSRPRPSFPVVLAYPYTFSLGAVPGSACTYLQFFLVEGSVTESLDSSVLIPSSQDDEGELVRQAGEQGGTRGRPRPVLPTPTEVAEREVDRSPCEAAVKTMCGSIALIRSTFSPRGRPCHHPCGRVGLRFLHGQRRQQNCWRRVLEGCGEQRIRLAPTLCGSLTSGRRQPAQISQLARGRRTPEQCTPRSRTPSTWGTPV